WGCGVLREASSRHQRAMSLAAPARPSFLLEHVRLCLKHVSATYSVCSPPPCGDGLGLGIHQRITGRPPPHRLAPPPPTRGGAQNGRVGRSRWFRFTMTPLALAVRVEGWPIAGSFAISRGAKTEAVVVVAELSDGTHRGRGECVPYARYGETVEGVAAAIEA